MNKHNTIKIIAIPLLGIPVTSRSRNEYVELSPKPFSKQNASINLCIVLKSFALKIIHAKFTNAKVKNQAK